MTTSATLFAAGYCSKQTKSFIIRAQLFQARLQDLGRIFGIALAFNVKESATNYGQIFTNTLELCDGQLYKAFSRAMGILHRMLEFG
jgi:hypothetical protein